MTEILRMGGIYWCLTAMALMDKLDMMNKDEILKFVVSCQHECGGFGASVDHDPHLLHTLSAIQVFFTPSASDKLIDVLNTMPTYLHFLIG